jgi:hypothetical protein
MAKVKTHSKRKVRWESVNKPLFELYVEACTSFYKLSGTKKLAIWVVFWTPTQLHSRLSTSRLQTPPPPHHQP